MVEEIKDGEVSVKVGSPREAYLTTLIRETEDRILKNNIHLDIDSNLLDRLKFLLEQEKE